MPPPPPPPPPNPFLSTVLNTADNWPTSSTTSPTLSATTPPPRHTSSTNNSPFRYKALPPLSAAQQSAQARGKTWENVGVGRKEEDSYEVREQREAASRILEDVELLIWHSGARNETISQTREHYKSILYGLKPPSPLWREEWEMPPSQRVKSGDVGASPGTAGSPRTGSGGRGKEKEREREREKRKTKH